MTESVLKLTTVQLDSSYSLLFSSNTPKEWVENFNTIGALQQWLVADRRAEFGNDFITNSTREQWKTIVHAQGGLEAGLKWYKSYLRGINSADANGKTDPRCPLYFTGSNAV